MKPETQLWIRKRALMLLRAIVWRLDEWIHAQETKLREELSAVPEAHKTHGEQHLSVSSGPAGHASPQKSQADTEKRVMPHTRPLRASGSALKRKRRISAAAFDLRFQP